jgi:preprotein translocase subunit YajC
MFTETFYPIREFLSHTAYTVRDLFFSNGVYAMAAPQQQAGNGEQGGVPFLGSPLVMMALIFVIFYFLLIRPQSKRAKEHKTMLENVKKGDKILTSGGIHGVIEGVDSDTLTVKISENVKIKLSRSGVASLRK